MGGKWRALWAPDLEPSMKLCRQAILSAALACLVLPAAMAEEVSGWHGDVDPHGARLFYGDPQSEHPTISFSCTVGGNGLTFVFAFVLVDPIESAEVDVLLKVDGSTEPIRTTGMHDEDATSRLYILKGKTVLDDQLRDLITSDGVLTVIVGKEEWQYPLAGVRDAAAPLLKNCADQSLNSGEQATICRLYAWSTDPDPAGQSVRSGPGAEYPVIGRLPPPVEVEGETFATEVSIAGSSNGWFQIKEATTDNYIVDHGPTVVFEGEGWLSGEFLGLSIEGRGLFSRPSRHAPVTLDFHDTSEIQPGTDDRGLELERLHACVGNWVEVEVSHTDRRFRGWTNDVCSSQVTTCP